MADLPIAATGALRRRLLPAMDVEGKVPRALAALGPLAGRDVVLLDADRGHRVGQLAALGARVTAVVPPDDVQTLRRALARGGPRDLVTVATGTGTATGLAAGSADVVVGFWTCFRPGADGEVAEAERVLRPGGRLLAVHDYARDDLSAFFPPERSRELVAWSRRDGWYLAHGFRVHVIHAFWTFLDTAAMRGAMRAAFGDRADGLLADRQRARLSWKVVVYHRPRGEGPADIAVGRGS